APHSESASPENKDARIPFREALGVRCVLASLSRDPPLSRYLLQQLFVHPDTAFQISEREIFVRRMRPAIGQSQPAKQCFRAQYFPEIGDDGDTAAFTNDRDVAAERFL